MIKLPLQALHRASRSNCDTHDMSPQMYIELHLPFSLSEIVPSVLVNYRGLPILFVDPLIRGYIRITSGMRGFVDPSISRVQVIKYTNPRYSYTRFTAGITHHEKLLLLHLRLHRETPGVPQQDDSADPGIIISTKGAFASG